jgi:hypothetical protein
MTDTDLLSIGEAAAIVGICRESMSRRLAKSGVTLWVDPADNRRRLITRADLDAVGFALRPAAPSRRKEAAAA